MADINCGTLIGSIKMLLEGGDTIELRVAAQPVGMVFDQMISMCKLVHKEFAAIALRHQA